MQTDRIGPNTDGSHDEHAELEQTWRDPPGFLGWFCAINHKTIGKRFMLTTFAFFLAGGLLAAAMRLQLAVPDNHLIGPDLYNQLFSMHGTTMMFLFAVPVMQAVAVYQIPLMIGARSIAFPRLNAYAYWIFLMGGLMLYSAFLLNTGPDAGWFSYVPLASADYSPGKRIDFWAQMITFTELSALLEAVILITTIFKLRAPGMTLDRIPLFVWSILVTAFMVLFAMPSVMLGSTALLTDRLVGTHFYNAAEGGDALLWQHLFWFFGHPEVYLIFIPGLGFLSSIIATFSRRPVYGYPAMVLSLIATAFLAFGLWVHHMFATNLPEVGKGFFTAASMLIAIPSAVQIFCWIATLWRGRLHFKTPLFFVLAFFFILVLGGMTGLMLAAVPLDLQVHDTYFVVAHLHYVLLGGAIFPLFGAVYYWFPKWTGAMLDERWGRWHFWLFFIGFNLTFFPMHQLGLQGMPRRIYTYAADTGWGNLSLLATIGMLVMAAGVLCFLGNLVRSLRQSKSAPDNPWGGGTLEWATSSPPPAANFDRMPVVHAREPLWQKQVEKDDHGVEAMPIHVIGLESATRQVLVTTVVDALPDHRPHFPTPSIWPFLSALATSLLFIGSIFTPWAVVWGLIPVAIAMTFWFWRNPQERENRYAQEQHPHEPPA